MSQISTAAGIASLAHRVPWLAALPTPEASALLASMRRLELEAGGLLFAAGTPSDALYLVLSGSLGAFDAKAPAHLLGQVVAGETVGETGLLTGRPRGANVRALRDSVLLQLDRGGFEALGRSHPGALLAMAQLALARTLAPAPSTRGPGPRTLAVLPQHTGLDARPLAEALADALRTEGSVAVLLPGEARDADALAQVEAAHRYTLYVADAADSPWRARVLRQADALLMLGTGGRDPAPWAELVRGELAPLPRPEHLLVASGREGQARALSRRRPGARVHRWRDARDAARIARLVTGRPTTLVLSGGGARGFAQIGVVRALREHGVAIDAVGGTSIGAILGAGIASEWSHEQMLGRFRRAFVDSNPLGDYTVPFVSLVSGRRVAARMRDAFGDVDIEDLPMPFFCISADLRDGRAALHDTGTLWQALRATVAIPGVLPPVFRGGRVFVDGGVVDNLPVPTMRERWGGQVIAVDIGGEHAIAAPADLDETALPSLYAMVREWFHGRRRPSMLKILLRAGMIHSGTAAAAARAQASLAIQPPLSGIDLLDWRAFDRAIEIGYRHAREVLTKEGGWPPRA